MWHASASPVGGWVTARNAAGLFEAAAQYLRGVGDATLGEWREVGAKACHLRRRLSHREAALVGPVQDLRGQPEAARRLFRAKQWLPLHLWPVAERELERGCE